MVPVDGIEGQNAPPGALNVCISTLDGALWWNEQFPGAFLFRCVVEPNVGYPESNGKPKCNYDLSLTWPSSITVYWSVKPAGCAAGAYATSGRINLYNPQLDHELGHVKGLGHVGRIDVPNDLPYPLESYHQTGCNDSTANGRQVKTCTQANGDRITYSEYWLSTMGTQGHFLVAAHMVKLGIQPLPGTRFAKVKGYTFWREPYMQGELVSVTGCGPDPVYVDVHGLATVKRGQVWESKTYGLRVAP